MTNAVEKYTEQLQQLMPRGVLWDDMVQPDTLFTKLLTALAEEFARVEARTEQLINETDPRTMYEMLFDWETWLGLPDRCSIEAETLQQRRQAVLDLLTSTGGQSRQYFIDLAAKLGYTITITEFFPHTVSSPVNYPLYGSEWLYIWQVNALNQGEEIRYMTVMSGVNEPLSTRDSNILECAINRLKPAHTRVLFNYGD